MEKPYTRRRRYPLEFKTRLVELVRAGHSPAALAREFEPTAHAIRRWVRQADHEEGRREDGLTTNERTELTQLRRENARLRCIDALSPPRPGSHGRRARLRPSLRIHEGAPRRPRDGHHVPAAGRLPQRVLRVAGARHQRAGTARCRAHTAHSADSIARVVAPMARRAFTPS